MSVRFACPRCGTKLKVDDELSGQVAACPGCGRKLDVPQALVPAKPVLARRPTVTAGSSHTNEDELPLVKPLPHIDHEELIDMTAMVDIVFFLLIFFLVTSMQSLDSAIPMPSPDPQKGAGREQKTEDPESDDEYVIVRIDKNDAIQVDGVAVQDVQDLVAKLKELRFGARKSTKMLVVGNGDASHGMTVAVLDSGHEAGMERVRLAISDDNE